MDTKDKSEDLVEENSPFNPDISKNSDEDSPEFLKDSKGKIITNEISLQEEERPIRRTNTISLPKKGTELFVGNLEIGIEKGDLYSLFSKYGEISDVRIHKNQQTKKCYAFVRFQNKEMANNALALNLYNLKGRKIKVTKSNENSAIFIGNIRKTWNAEDIERKVRRIFHNVGKIEYFPDPNNPQRNRGFCFAIFNNRNEAIKALNYVGSKGGINIDGIPLTCDWADVVDDDDSNSKQIFLSGVKEEVEEEDLKGFFSLYGQVTAAVMSKTHRNSKRKDLVFITFNSHGEATNAVASFIRDKNDPSKFEEIKKVFKIEKEKDLNHIAISLAFSQKAMQTKKKIKDNRRKINHISNKVCKALTSDEKGQEKAETVLPSQLLTNQLFSNNINSTAMLAMMNLININKNNPALFSQMMSGCFGGSDQNTPNNTYSSFNYYPQQNQNTNNKKFLNNKRRPSPPSPNITSPSIPLTNFQNLNYQTNVSNLNYLSPPYNTDTSNLQSFNQFNQNETNNIGTN